MNEERAERCDQCRFWDMIDEDDGLCKRNAPRMAGEVSMADEIAPDSPVWPMTHQLDWCGEFQPREKSEQISVDPQRLVSSIFMNPDGMLPKWINGVLNKIHAAYFEKTYGWRWRGHSKDPTSIKAHQDSLFGQYDIPLYVLLDLTENDLIAARNLGEKTLRLIQDALAQHGLKLKNA